MSERIPQRGLPKPPPKLPPQYAAMANLVSFYTNKNITGPDKLGRYLYWESKENRYCRQVPIGAKLVCVVDEFGFLVPVDRQEDTSWY